MAFKKGTYHHSEKVRRKMSEADKGRPSPRKGVRLSDEIKRKLSENHKGINTWSKGKPLLKLRGKNSPNWKGGHSRGYKEKYWSLDYKLWRTAVFERDGYICQVCRKVGIYLTAHHIKSWSKYPKSRFEINNGITLCEDCHKLTDNYKGREKKKI